MRPIRLYFCVGAIVFLLQTVPLTGQTLEVVPSTAVPAVGSTLTVDVNVSGLAAGTDPSQGAFDLDLTFDPAVLSFVGVGFGTFLGDESAMPTEAVTGAVPSGGLLNAFEVSLLAPADLNALQPSGFTLYTVTFDVISSGTTSLDLSLNSALSDENGDPIATVADTQVVGAFVGAGPVDIPTLSGWGALSLMLALAGAAVFLMRRI